MFLDWNTYRHDEPSAEGNEEDEMEDEMEPRDRQARSIRYVVVEASIKLFHCNMFRSAQHSNDGDEYDKAEEDVFDFSNLGEAKKSIDRDLKGVMQQLDNWKKDTMVRTWGHIKQLESYKFR